MNSGDNFDEIVLEVQSNSMVWFYNFASPTYLQALSQTVWITHATANSLGPQ